MNMNLNRKNRREYAEKYWSLKKAISQMHRAGNYIASAHLRTSLNLVFKCWQHSKAA